eukprot:m.306967 g.306967  ORF g.306967 m.306967 type:complete len:253 (-) comp19557_c0_seq1:254-1012(-)
MGSFSGHAMPGIFLLVFGAWNTLMGCKQFHTQRGSTWHSQSIVGSASNVLMQVRLMVAACIIGVIVELSSTRGHFVEDGEIQHMNDFGHAAMYIAFAMFAGSVWMGEHIAMPPGLDYLLFALAFFAEGMLFLFHLEGRVSLDVQIHTLVYWHAFMISGLLVAEFLRRDLFALAFLRNISIAAHGIWFVTVGHILYISPWSDNMGNRGFLTPLFFYIFFLCFGAAMLTFLNFASKSRGLLRLPTNAVESIPLA